MTVAVVTGANSGIGRQTAVDLAGKGWTVFGSMRSLDKGEKLAAMAKDAGVTVTPVVCDVTDTASVDAAIAEVTAAAGQIDVMVNNAGVGGNGSVEESPIEDYATVMDVNLHGVLRCCKAVLPQMRERGNGTIVNVSSVIGRFAGPAQAPYVASKWAVEGVSEELAHEVAQFGIRVAIIEPGIVRTAIMAKNTDVPDPTGPYAATYRRMFGFYGKGLMTPGHPHEVADVIHEAVVTDTPRLRWTCGWGGEQLANNNVTAEQWVELGRLADDDEYQAAFTDLYGLDIRLDSGTTESGTTESGTNA